MKRLILLSTIIFLTFQSCMSMYQTSNQKTDQEKIKEWKDSLVGKPEKFLYALRGMPDREWTDGAGGKIVLYEDIKQGYTSTYGYFVVKWITQVYIDKNGIIYDYRAWKK